MQHVVRVVSTNEGAGSEDLSSLVSDLSELLGGVSSRELRGVDEAVAEAAAELIAGLRSAMDLAPLITSHECRHDEGIGDCSAVVEIR